MKPFYIIALIYFNTVLALGAYPYEAIDYQIEIQQKLAQATQCSEVKELVEDYYLASFETLFIVHIAAKRCGLEASECKKELNPYKKADCIYKKLIH